jgi:hypothetical protein
MILKARFKALSHALAQARITHDQAKVHIEQLASKFQIDLTIMLSAVGTGAGQF